MLIGNGNFRLSTEFSRPSRDWNIRGLNSNHNHELKNLFKAAATSASASKGVFLLDIPFYRTRQADLCRIKLNRPSIFNCGWDILRGTGKLRNTNEGTL
jgi:hypothetical protein